MSNFRTGMTPRGLVALTDAFLTGELDWNAPIPFNSYVVVNGAVDKPQLVAAIRDTALGVLNRSTMRLTDTVSQPHPETLSPSQASAIDTAASFAQDLTTSGLRQRPARKFLADLAQVVVGNVDQSPQAIVQTASTLAHLLSQPGDLDPVVVRGEAASLARTAVDDATVSEPTKAICAISYAFTALMPSTRETDPSTNLLPLGPTPVADERMAFERLWGLVEAAAGSGRLDTTTEDEIRALNQILQISTNELDPDRDADLVRLVSGKIAALLPDVLDALLPGETPPESVLLAAQGAPIDDQLTAMSTDLDQVAGVLDSAVRQIDDEPDQEPQPVIEPTPYFQGSITQINERFYRIDKTIAELRRTKTGRAILRIVQSGFVAAPVLIAAAVTDVVSFQAAGAASIFISWLYTAIRRSSMPWIPARNPASPTDEHVAD